MKFQDLLYNPDEEIFIFYTKSQVQAASLMVIGRELKPSELNFLRDKTLVEIRKLMVKIESSGIKQ